jgi:hypothetical protein
MKNLKAAWLCLIAIAYLSGLVLTYGYAFNIEKHSATQHRWTDEGDISAAAIVDATFWPLYVPLHMSREHFETP